MPDNKEAIEQLQHWTTEQFQHWLALDEAVAEAMRRHIAACEKSAEDWNEEMEATRQDAVAKARQLLAISPPGLIDDDSEFMEGLEELEGSQR
jgi:predicted Holliday junction resolvase-like endonuclease